MWNRYLEVTFFFNGISAVALPVFIYENFGFNVWEYDREGWLLLIVELTLISTLLIINKIGTPSNDESLISLWFRVRKKKLRDQLKDD